MGDMKGEKHHAPNKSYSCHGSGSPQNKSCVLQSFISKRTFNRNADENSPVILNEAKGAVRRRPILTLVNAKAFHVGEQS